MQIFEVTIWRVRRTKYKRQITGYGVSTKFTTHNDITLNELFTMFHAGGETITQVSRLKS